MDSIQINRAFDIINRTYYSDYFQEYELDAEVKANIEQEVIKLIAFPTAREKRKQLMTIPNINTLERKLKDNTMSETTNEIQETPEIDGIEAPQVDQERVDSILSEERFSVLAMESDPEEKFTRLVVVHEVHPEDEVFIDILTKDEDDEDILEMQFSGPDTWTEEEAKEVLQDVMDTFVKIIESAVADGENEIGSRIIENTEDGENDDSN